MSEIDINVFANEGNSTNSKILKLIENHDVIGEMVKSNTEDMFQKNINVESTMQNLVACGELLQIADIGSNNFEMNTVVKG